MLTPPPPPHKYLELGLSANHLLLLLDLQHGIKFNFFVHSNTIIFQGSRLSLVLPVHLTQSDCNTCPKLDMCHHFNRSNAVGHWTNSTGPKLLPFFKYKECKQKYKSQREMESRFLMICTTSQICWHFLLQLN